MKTYLTILMAALSLALMGGCTPNDQTDTALEEAGVEAMDETSDAAEATADAAEDIDDETTAAGVTASVKTALINSLNVDAEHIDVDTEDGVIYLRGWVADEEMRSAAENLAIGTAPDGYSVVNELNIGGVDEDDPPASP